MLRDDRCVCLRLAVVDGREVGRGWLCCVTEAVEKENMEAGEAFNSRSNFEGHIAKALVHKRA